MIAEIDLLIGKNTEHATALLEEVRKDLLEQIRPLKFNESNPQSVIHTRQESFERLCYQLRKNNIDRPEAMSTYSFYKSVDLLREEIELKKRKNG
jgi:hypothetical protein